MKFGEKLRHLREKKNISQQKLAEMINTSGRKIRTYEIDGRYPRDRKIYQQLADALEVDVNYLLTEDEEFIVAANQRYGYRGKKQAEELVEEMGGLFAGGEMSEEDMDGVMRAMQEIYWKAKDENKKKYTPKKYRENVDE